jgi:hypothetical protein
MSRNTRFVAMERDVGNAWTGKSPQIGGSYRTRRGILDHERNPTRTYEAD